MKQLRDIVLTGFSNVYSIVSILAFTLAFSIWQSFKLTEGPEKVKDTEEEILAVKEDPGPSSTIIAFAILLFAFNLFQFYKNNALRFSFAKTL